jgi:FkbM family methyltransferase
MSFKGRVADRVGRALGLYIIQRKELWSLVERHCLELFLKTFKVDCVFDVGAHEGQYASRVRGSGFGGPIISFEPIPKLADILRNKAKADPNWYIEEVALDECERRADLKILAASALSSLLEPVHPSPHFVVVETVSVRTGVLARYLDKYRNQLGVQRPFLKIDAQGMDLAVAKGAGPCLHEFVGLYIEPALVNHYSGQDDYKAQLAFYQQNGFQLAATLTPPTRALSRLAEINCFMINERKTP